MAGPKGAERGSWTAVALRRLCGGFAGASRRLRENVPSFLAKPGLKRTVLFRSSSCNLSHATAMKAHNTLAMIAHNTLQPRSGFAK